MPSVFCPDCKEALSLGPNTEAGKRLTCPHCSTDLEVINTSPLELDFAYDELGILWESEDWDCEGRVEAVGRG
jgi:hypothetical protein